MGDDSSAAAGGGDGQALNVELATRSGADLDRRLRGKGQRKGLLLEADRRTLLPMPATPFEACRTVSTTASSLSLVRFHGNDYSVAVRYAHRPVVVEGLVDRVAMSHPGQAIARLWTKEDVSSGALPGALKHKPGALDHAWPVAD